MVKIIVPKYEEVRVKIDGNSIVLVSSKGTSIRIPYQVIPILARVMRKQGKVIEEMVNVHRIIGDQAFMLRAGIPIGLTDHPGMRADAAHEAQFNDRLRKELPGGVKSTVMVGTPTVIQHKPKEVK